jgi:hypothetical protein
LYLKKKQLWPGSLGPLLLCAAAGCQWLAGHDYVRFWGVFDRKMGVFECFLIGNGVFLIENGLFSSVFDRKWVFLSVFDRKWGLLMDSTGNWCI